MAAASVYAESPAIIVTDPEGGTTSLVLEHGMAGTYYYQSADSKVINLEIVKGHFTYDENGNRIPDVNSSNPGEVIFDMPVSSISRIDFKGALSDVKEIMDDNGLVVDLADSVLKFRQVTSPVELLVYTPDGVMESRMTVDKEMEIDLREFGIGLHIVKAGNRTFKILVK